MYILKPEFYSILQCTGTKIKIKIKILTPDIALIYVFLLIKQ